ncbi:MAG: hypothetical protein ABI821_07890 [Pseudomonadota bacterium]
MFLAHLAWFGVVVAAARVDGFMPLVVILLLVVLNIAAVAAFMIARRATRFGLLQGLTMAPLTAALGTATNLLFGLARVRVDISGFYDNAGLFTSLLMYGTVVSAVGGAIGMSIGRKRAAEMPAPVTAAPVVAETLPEISVAPAPVADDLPQIRSD